MKRERIKRTICKDREVTRQDLFNDMEMCYRMVRQHGFNDNLSPIEHEKQYAVKE